VGVLELEHGCAGAGAWACCKRESKGNGERKFVNAKMERTASNKYEEKCCEREKGKRSGKREKNDAN
jgi:hypothetical protein